MSDTFNYPHADWNLLDVVLVLPIIFGGSNLVFRVIEFIFKFSFSSPLQVFLLNILQSALLILFTLSIVMIKYDYSLADLGLRKIRFVQNIKYGLLGGIVIWLLITIANNLLYSLTTKLFGFAPPTQQAIKTLLDSQNIFLFLLHSFLILIIAPITEELFFRGFVYPYCKKKLGKVQGIIISGIIFGLAHFSFWVFFSTFIGGMILAWIYEQSNSLYPAIIAHGTWNGIVVLLIYLLWTIS